MFKFVSSFVMTDIQQNPQWDWRWRAVSVVSIGSVINSVAIVSLRAVESPKAKRKLTGIHIGEIELKSQSWRVRVEEPKICSLGWFNQPWLPQLQFKTTMLYSGGIGSFPKPSQMSVIVRFSRGNIQVSHFSIVYCHSAYTPRHWMVLRTPPQLLKLLEASSPIIGKLWG